MGIGPDDLGRLFDAHAAALALYARQWRDGPGAEDAVQDAFVALALQSRIPERPAAWLHRVVRNAALSARRGSRRRRERETRAGRSDAEPWFQAVDDRLDAREAGREAEWTAAERGPAGLAALFAPSLASCRIATARLDRRVAALRAVEAVRTYAAAHEGRPPTTLGDVREAPVPVDPMTGEPFGWTVDGGVATLSVPEPRWAAPDYRITIRKP